MFCNSGCIYSDCDNVRYTVYRWWFSSLDYSFNVLISWSRNLGCTAGFCRICFYRVLIRIFDFIIIIILYIPDFTTCVLLLWSPAVIILYTACLLPDITLVLLHLTSWLAYSWLYTDSLVTIQLLLPNDS